MSNRKNNVLRVCVSLCVLMAYAPLTEAERDPTPVFVANVERVYFVDEVEALGTLQAVENVDITSSVTERLTKIHFEDNQRVKQGDLLVEMDASEEQAEYAEEISRLKEAQQQVERVRELAKRSSASQATLDERERELNTAKARIVAIESRINERRIEAPFDGVVGFRNISVGALAQPGLVITTLDDDSRMKLDFSVPEVFLSSLKKGLSIEAKASAYPGQLFTGTVTSIDSRVDPITRSVKARASLDNADGLLKGGMLMRVKLNKNPRQTLVAPEESIVTIGGQNAVMMIEQAESAETAKVKRQVVELGARRKGVVEILRGVNEGQQIVTHGALNVRDGAEVIIKAVEQKNETLMQLLEQSSRGRAE